MISFLQDPTDDLIKIGTTVNETPRFRQSRRVYVAAPATDRAGVDAARRPQDGVTIPLRAPCR
jgi:hypothetical protein